MPIFRSTRLCGFFVIPIITVNTSFINNVNLNIFKLSITYQNVNLKKKNTYTVLHALRNIILLQCYNSRVYSKNEIKLVLLTLGSVFFYMTRQTDREGKCRCDSLLIEFNKTFVYYVRFDNKSFTEKNTYIKIAKNRHRIVQRFSIGMSRITVI